jgi:glycosyltransferase involved in cell wall biosynthesis
MHIGYIGNTCNNSFNFLKMMRERGHSATLYYERNRNPQTFPESEDPAIAACRPDWIRPFSYQYYSSEAWKRPPPGLLEEFSAFDILHVEDVALIWAQQTGKPYGWQPYGMDIQFYPFASYGIESRFVKNKRLYPWYITAPIRFRRAIAGAAFVNLVQWMEVREKTYQLLAKLIMPEQRVSFFFPIDAALFSPGQGADMNALLLQSGSSMRVKGLKIFHPTRIMFTSATTYNYGSDVLLRILRRFADTGREFTLVVVEKGNVDEAPFKALIAQYGLDEHVAWIPMQKRHALVPWYQAADVVTSEFGFGGFGSISFETLACGACLMTAFHKDWPAPTFFLPAWESLPPYLSANTEEEALKNLVLCADNPSLREEYGKQGREWVLRTVSRQALAPRYERVCLEAIARHPVKPLKPVYDPPSPLVPRAIALHLKKGDQAGAFTTLGSALDENPEDPMLLGIAVRLYEMAGGATLANQLRLELDELELEVAS